MDVLLGLLLLRLGLLVVVGHQGELSLALHAGVNNLSELLLVLLLDTVNVFPGLVFNVLSLLLVLGHKLLASLSKCGGLALLLLKLEGIFGFEILKDLLVLDKEVVEALLKLLCLLLLLVVELLITLVVCLLLVSVVLFTTSKFRLMVSSHLTELVVVNTL